MALSCRRFLLWEAAATNPAAAAPLAPGSATRKGLRSRAGRTSRRRSPPLALLPRQRPPTAARPWGVDTVPFREGSPMDWSPFPAGPSSHDAENQPHGANARCELMLALFCLHTSPCRQRKLLSNAHVPARFS